MSGDPVPILFLIDELETWGGTERQLFELSRALDRLRFRPVIAVLGRTRQVPRFRRAGLPVLELRLRRIYGPRVALALGRLATLCLGAGVRMIVTYHVGADLLGPPLALAAGAVALSSRRDLGFARRPRHLRAQRAINRWVAGMTAVSHAVRRAVCAQEGFPASRIRVIHNGVDAARYAPLHSRPRAELGVRDDEVLVGTLAHFEWIKGYDVLVPAIERLCARTSARVVCFGDGPLRGEVSRRLSHLADRVLLPGARADVADALSALDVFVLASHSEGFSNALLEAMAAGRAVCATDVGGNPELVDERTGVLVPPGRPDELAAALEALCLDPSRRRALGEAARARVVRDFSLTGMVRRHEDLFETLLDETFGRRSRRLAKHAAAHLYAASRPLLRTALPAAALTLCYHRVAEEPGGWNPSLTVSRDVFRRQLEALAGSYELVTCSELGQALAAGERRRMCAVSFDDGYADNLELALPILRSVGASATVFVATDPMDRGRALWFERLAAVLGPRLEDPALAKLCRAHPALARLPAVIAGASSARAALRAVVGALKHVTTRLREDAEELLVTAFGPPDAAALPRFLDWDGLRTLRDAGVEIGAHTRTHPILPATDPVRARDEILGGRARLEAELGAPVQCFAYPNGDHDAATVELVRRTGFSWAFIIASHPWDGDPHRIPRCVVMEQTSRGYAGAFSSAAFFASIEGWFNRLRT